MTEPKWKIEHDVSHDELLRLAEGVEAAAAADDRAELALRVRRLLSALAEHLDDEAPRGVLDLDLAEAMSRGKHRVVEEFVGLAREAATWPTDDCQCALLAQRAIARLRDQIEAEANESEHG